VLFNELAYSPYAIEKERYRKIPFFHSSLAFITQNKSSSVGQIAQSYHAGVSTLQWVVDAYTLAFAVLMLSAGSLSDRLGALRIFQTGIMIFCIASAGCGLADSSIWLVVFRVLQGIGAATMIPSSLAILNQAFAHEPSTRIRAVGLWTAIDAQVPLSIEYMNKLTK
jgi:DHA2 family methylenomycin A resistance protein-like MFS transporter